MQFRAQFDRTDLGVPYILDQFLIPINDQGANWDMFRDQYEVHVKKRNRRHAFHHQTKPDEAEADASQTESALNGVTLANQIPSQMLYYKILLDKHDYRQLNTLQDLNNQLKSAGAQGNQAENSQQTPSQDANSKAQNSQERFLNGLEGERGSLQINNKNYFVKFEHTNFSDQNIKAMAMLIMLLNRKNAIIKNLSLISNERKQILPEQSSLKQRVNSN